MVSKAFLVVQGICLHDGYLYQPFFFFTVGWRYEYLFVSNVFRYG
jgi:hypothetical protein